jgi:alkanesulfonate monooxygenase SsuD/methylene tetrahydromethanopterin reductase-like flavin-dependent oxidoreductase (luciferase family)
MVRTVMTFDLRAPAFAAPIDALYEHALEFASLADEWGLTGLMLSEHHRSDDGYLPSPFVFAGAVAARTHRIRLFMSAVVLPLHNPVRVAEDAVVLDVLSGGRVDIVATLGYVPSEYESLGRDFSRRGAVADEGLRVLRAAFTGEEFLHDGRRVRVTPKPRQAPGPPLYVGGGVPASARRAARFGDGFWPTVPDPALFELYREECERLHRKPGPTISTGGPLGVFITDDPDDGWERVGRSVLHVVNSYGRWAHEAQGIRSPYEPAEDVRALRESGMAAVVTPDEALRLAERLGAEGATFWLHPLMGGVDPEFARRSLDLFAEQVLPRMEIAPAPLAHEPQPDRPDG